MPNPGYKSIVLKISTAQYKQILLLGDRYSLGHSTMARSLWSAGLLIMLLAELESQPYLSPLLDSIEPSGVGPVTLRFSVLDKELERMRSWAKRHGKKVSQSNRDALGYGIRLYGLIGEVEDWADGLDNSDPIATAKG